MELDRQQTEELRRLLLDAVRSFSEDSESLSDRIYWIIETKLEEE